MSTLTKIAKFITSAFSAIVFYGALLILGVLFIPRLFGIQPNIVMSDSMSPTFKAGDLAFINHRADYNDAKVGDVVCRWVRNPRNNTKEAMVHRVIAITENGIVTKGDNNENEDGAFTSEDWVGKVSWTIPKVGAALDYIHKSTTGKILVFLVFGVGILVGFFDFDTTDDEEKKAYNPPELSYFKQGEDSPQTENSEKESNISNE